MLPLVPLFLVTHEFCSYTYVTREQALQKSSLHFVHVKMQWAQRNFSQNVHWEWISPCGLLHTWQWRVGSGCGKKKFSVTLKFQWTRKWDT